MGVLEAEVGRERAGGGGVESDMCIKPGRGAAMQYRNSTANTHSLQQSS